jgi:hypothetical protein
MSGRYTLNFIHLQSKLTGFTLAVKLTENASSQNWQKSLVQSKLMEITNSQN